MRDIQFGTAERGGRYLNFSLEREWSCPLHDRDVNEWDFDDDEWDFDDDDEHGREGDDEFECNSCRAAGWRIVYDADGWATIVVAEEGPFGSFLRSMRAPLVEGLRHSNLLLSQMIEHQFAGDKTYRVPLTIAPLPRSAAAQAALDADQP